MLLKCLTLHVTTAHLQYVFDMRKHLQNVLQMFTAFLQNVFSIYVEQRGIGFKDAELPTSPSVLGYMSIIFMSLCITACVSRF